jgi:hypothetical protein
VSRLRGLMVRGAPVLCHERLVFPTKELYQPSSCIVNHQYRLLNWSSIATFHICRRREFVRRNGERCFNMKSGKRRAVRRSFESFQRVNDLKKRQDKTRQDPVTISCASLHQSQCHLDKHHHRRPDLHI